MYADGTSGWSGSETSRERAVTEDTTGVSAMREREALAYLGEVGEQGTIWKELAIAKGWHHGQASGVLSRLHKEGKIVRLTLVEQRCKVYVLPQYQAERPSEPHGRRSVVRVANRQRQAQSIYDVLRTNTGRDILGIDDCRHLTGLILEAIQP